LKQIVTGYFHYHAVPTNSRALARFHHYIAHLWLRVLRRRSQRDGITWDNATKTLLFFASPHTDSDSDFRLASGSFIGW
jgi:hypothetical protein